ncbi:hypothetical protein CF326_g7266 [Tilletia indica]|nr:hypothetical protein CF326_g7266 [Tilletia indica]
MNIKGLGAVTSLGWSTITFFIDATTSRGRSVSVECTLDFHVLEAFAPGLCLGQDFISAHGVAIHPKRGQAMLRGDAGPLTFSVHDQMPAPFASHPELCLTRDVVVPARSHMWVPIDSASLAPGLDYTAHPRMSVDASEHVRIAGPLAVINSTVSQLLVTNLGTLDAPLARRTPVADAVVAQLGDVHLASPHTFELRAGSPDAQVHTAEGTPVVATAAEAEPLEMCEQVDDIDASPPPEDPATVLVDGAFKIGVNESGEPPEALVDVLRRHRAAFALDGVPGRVVGHEMPIDLVDERALHPEAPRRASPEKQQAMDTAIDQLLQWDVIEPSTSPISFPVLMVRQYAKWRFCVDYRQLNAHTIPDAYPLPTTDSIFNSLAGKKIYSSLDAIRGYHQLPVREQDRWKTAFTCHRGLFQYKTVPFGLRNAPAVFQRLMDSLLGELRWRVAVVYIDDVVVATHDMDEHVRALDILLGRAEEAGLRFSPAKCTFGISSLVLLGRKVSGAGVAVWSDRARAVLDLPRPTTLRELYHTMGLFGYYRSFIPGFASIASPLTELTRGWRYERLGDRSRLVAEDGSPANADRVEIPWGDEQQLAFDRLKQAIASPPVLAHPDPSRPYLLYVDASKEGFGAVLHQVFDADDPAPTPSRAAAVVQTLDTSLLPPHIAKERWRAWLQRDRHFGPVLRAVEAGDDTSEWTVTDGVLVRRGDGRVALPEGGLPDLLRATHDRRGHFGFTKTFLALSRHFWRPGLSVAVRAWVAHCSVCRATKLDRRSGRLDIEDDAAFPFEAFALDLLLGFPRSRAGNDAVLVLLDLFSRMVLLEPCSASVTAEGIAAIISNRILRYGWRPRKIVPDSESKLTGEVMSTLATSLRAELAPSVPHHHQANPAERCIQTVKHVLQALCLGTRAHWDRRAIPAAELAVNSTPSVSTGFRPFDLVFVSHPDVVHAVFDSDGHPGVNSFPERLAAANARLEDARVALEEARGVQKRRYDASRAPLPALAVGDEVFVRLPDRPVPGVADDKLAPRKLGPFKVKEVLGDHRVRLTLPEDMRIGDTFSVSQLDALPRAEDPFSTHRAGLPPTADSSTSTSSSRSPSPPPLPPRARRAPVALRGYETAPGLFTYSSAAVDALRGPYHRPRRTVLDGRAVVLTERPVAFLSRLTMPSEKKLVAAELELCCLAWAFGRFLHLLEGAEVTVVTDHSPLGPMLTSTAGAKYGPVISKCRALLMPHLAHLRFLHRPGSSHTNADALSRLVQRPGTDS